MMEYIYPIQNKNILNEVERLNKYFLHENDEAIIEIRMPLDTDDRGKTPDIIFLTIRSHPDTLKTFALKEFRENEYNKCQLNELLIRFKDQIAIQDIEENGKENL